MTPSDNFQLVSNPTFEISRHTWRELEELRVVGLQLKNAMVRVYQSYHKILHEKNGTDHREYQLCYDLDPQWRQLAHAVDHCSRVYPVVTDNQISVPAAAVGERVAVGEALADVLTGAKFHGSRHGLVFPYPAHDGRSWNYEGPVLGPSLYLAEQALHDSMHDTNRAETQQTLDGIFRAGPPPVQKMLAAPPSSVLPQRKL